MRIGKAKDGLRSTIIAATPLQRVHEKGIRGMTKTALIIRLSLMIFILLVWASPARTEGFPVKSLPSVGNPLSDFIPSGWIVGDQASGDLNGDGIADMAAIVVQGGPAFDINKADDEPQRALIVLMGKDKGKFTLAGINDKLLQCKGCGGIKESVGISIKKGVIIVSQMSGSREFAIETWRFRYDPQTQRFVMIGRDLETGDGMRGTGKIESFNYMTGQKMNENYRYDASGEHKIATSTKKETGPREALFIEDVKPSY